MELAANTNDKRVLAAIAKNPNTPISVLEKLSTDENEYVRKIAENNLLERQTDRR